MAFSIGGRKKEAGDAPLPLQRQMATPVLRYMMRDEAPPIAGNVPPKMSEQRVHEVRLVRATAANFDADSYLAANPDLLAASREDPTFHPRGHFDRYGSAEGRNQFVPRDPAFMAERFRHFEPILHLAGARFLGGPWSLPIAFGDRHLNLSDYDAESSNAGVTEWVDALKAHPTGRFLDLGCGFRTTLYFNCLYLEVYPSLSADIIVEPGSRLPIRDGTLDGVGCFAVLEHVSDPFFLIDEIRRVVRPGGRIFIDWPFLQPVHGYPSHFHNATRAALGHAFDRGFEIERLETFASQGADFTVSWIMNWFVHGIQDVELRQELMAMSVADLLALQPQSEFYRRCLASLSDDMRMRLACGNTLIARRLPG